jgi:protein-disulfide isomerase
MTRHSLLLLLASVAFSGTATAHPVAKRSVHRPAAARVADWSRIASATAAGGFVMGNPAAKVKLVEFGSLTCPHCRHFDQEAEAPLIAGYVRSGKVSWEFRPFLLNGYDIPVTLTAACGGAGSFFPMLRALYDAQPQWVAKMQAIPADRLAAIQAMAEPQQYLAIGQAGGLPAFAAAHGIPAAKASACLADKARAERLVAVTADSANRLKVDSTPTFMINGTTVDYSAGPSAWSVVRARLDAALKA